ncbi:MAG: glycosyltransferase family 4 protein [Cytophagales bacterium]|nr:glycosyltransferase family 4 protein [Cytophaga sp.]
MNIAVNTRLLLEGRLEGIGSFTYETLKRITKQHPEHTFHFFFDRPYSDEFIFSKNVVPHVLYPQARHPILWYLFFEWSIPYMLKKVKADAFISTDGYMSMSTDVKTLNVIHDINFEHRPLDLPTNVARYYKRNVPKFAHKANRIVTVSEFSKKDIVETYKIAPEKIDVVYNGCNALYLPIQEEEKVKIRYKYASGRAFFLYIGSMHPRKNIINLMKAFDAFKKACVCDMKLLLVGNSMWSNKDIQLAYHELIYRHDIHFLGHVKTSELSKIMASAQALTFVPFFEGFGIPVLEAMNCDIPVITSNTTSLPEVAGNAALLVNPESRDSICAAMLRINRNPHTREKLITEGRIQREKFSWDKTASLLWESFETMMR